MPEIVEERLTRTRMSFEEFEAIPEGVKAEYLDGWAIVSPPANYLHQGIEGRLIVLLATSLDGVEVLPEAGVRTIRDGHRIPDISVIRKLTDIVWGTEPPILVVEVISRGSRSEDTLRKPGEYAAAGIGQYWLVDRFHRTLTVIENDDQAPAVLLELDDAHPTGDVTVGEYGTVHLDLRELLPN
jgi:Uma2 family endonuclease